MFQKAKQNRVFQNVVDQIQEAILEGTLKSGDMLPPERELTEMFKVSRGTLREALRVLEQKGLIKIKLGVGGGAVVRKLGTREVSRSLDLLIQYQRVSLKHLAEFREGVEGIVAGLAVERAVPENIEYLKELLKKAEACLERGISGWDEFITIDKQLHMELARISGNPIYELVIKTIGDNIHRYFERYLPREEAFIQQNYLDLCDIVEAVEKGEANRARLLVQNHVYHFNRIMEEKAQKEASLNRKVESRIF